LSPQVLVQNSEQVTAIVRRASRNRVPASKIAALLEKARASIGTGQAEQVIIAHLRDTLIIIKELEAQARMLDLDLESAPNVASSPLRSLGLSAPLIATIHAESDPITDEKAPLAVRRVCRT
jgi:hypothetical protein